MWVACCCCSDRVIELLSLSHTNRTHTSKQMPLTLSTLSLSVFLALPAVQSCSHRGLLSQLAGCKRTKKRKNDKILLLLLLPQPSQAVGAAISSPQFSRRLSPVNCASSITTTTTTAKTNWKSNCKK